MLLWLLLLLFMSRKSRSTSIMSSLIGFEGLFETLLSLELVLLALLVLNLFICSIIMFGFVFELNKFECCSWFIC